MSLWTSIFGGGTKEPAATAPAPPPPSVTLSAKQATVNDISALPDTLVASMTFYSLNDGKTYMTSRGLDAANLVRMYDNAGVIIHNLSGKVT